MGQRVGLSSPTVAERVRKMEDAGIITGYHAEVNPARLGFPVMAIIRMTSLSIVLSAPTIKKITPKPEDMPLSHTAHQ